MTGSRPCFQLLIARAVSLARQIRAGRIEVRCGFSACISYALRPTDFRSWPRRISRTLLAEELQEVRHGHETSVDRRNFRNVQLQSLNILVQIDVRRGRI